MRLSNEENSVVDGLVSTVVPVFNRPQMVRQAVESVLAQSHQRVEVIIVDDGSTDETPQAIQALCAQWPDRVQAMRTNNSGPGPAREAGRRRARGEFIQYLDSDDRLMPEKFEQQVRALEKATDCQIAYGITRLIDAEDRVLKEPYKWTAKVLPSLFPAILIDRWWCTHTPLYRRSLTDAIGPWSALRYSQDWEYDARAGALQAKLVHCPVLVSEHRQHANLRQTGTGKWLQAPDQALFLRTLFESATRAGLVPGSAECRHFSRWAFSLSRDAALAGQIQAADELWQLAAAAVGQPDLDLRAYRWAAQTFGWSRSARWMKWARILRGRTASADSRRLSWMN